VTDPAVANGVVYYASTIGSLVRAVDASTGSVLWYTLSAVSPLAPIVSNGLVFVSGDDTTWVFGR
jgi:outer membrane protein assembly factor BamB